MEKREREIEEMTEDLCAIECKGMKCNVCDHYGCEYRMLAEALYNRGYRKADEVAREIFEEIEDGIKSAISALQFENHPIHRKVKHEVYSRTMCFVKTIEKKYTEVGE